MQRRKDSKGRVLKEGESERKDGVYQYRWTDKTGKRHTLYASDLKVLRQKKDEAQRLEQDGLSQDSKTVTVLGVVTKYAEIHKASLKVTSVKNLESFMTMFSAHPFSGKLASSVSTTDAKLFVKDLYEKGYSYGTINNFKGILRPAFEMACDDMLLARNPFSFSLSKIVPKSDTGKTLLTKVQFDSLIEFCRGSPYYEKHVDELIILYETGLRVSEFCGLTFDDVDFENKTIRVNHQLVYLNNRNTVQTPKSKSGIRTVPMSQAASDSFRHLIQIRVPQETEPVVDGYSGFFQVSYKGNPRVSNNIEVNLKKVITSYNKENPQNPLPLITPHALRHMFCTRMIESGMNIKAVQYIMGHSKVGMTLDVYSHIDEERVVKEFFDITSLY